MRFMIDAPWRVLKGQLGRHGEFEELAFRFLGLNRSGLGFGTKARPDRWHPSAQTRCAPNATWRLWLLGTRGGQPGASRRKHRLDARAQRRVYDRRELRRVVRGKLVQLAG